MKIKNILLLTFVIMVVVIFMQNMELIEFSFLFWTVTLPKTVFSILFMALGLFFWLIIRRWFKAKASKKNGKETVADS